MQTLWLGYNGLDLPFRQIVAIINYRPALDPWIAASYGHVPLGVQAVVVTDAGNYLPARWPVERLRAQWTRWREVA
ncbi:MAG: hypothetical protein AB4911_13400 [Oscillochloridaceae bacterium umkhey_bin13]